MKTKNVYLIGGTMGVGKTSTCQELKKKLSNSVFLDGDWCWDSHPFKVNDETKAMVLDNICHLLNNFIHCTAYENIIFCWVMHEQGIIDTILQRIDTSLCSVKVISLICTEEELIKRLNKDIADGKRTPDIIERSVIRIPLYNYLDTIKIDVTSLSPEETANYISSL